MGSFPLSATVVNLVAEDWIVVWMKRKRLPIDHWRVTVGMVMGLIASGAEWEEILGHYPYLSKRRIFAPLWRMRPAVPRSENSPLRRSGESPDRHEPIPRD